MTRPKRSMRAGTPAPDAAEVEAALVAAERKAKIGAICGSISNGTLVQDACREAGITRTTLFRWCEADATLRNAYAHAREGQAHAIAEDAVRISDGTDDETFAQAQAIDAEAGRLVALGDPLARQKIAALESGVIQRAKLRVDTRKWLASKIAPRHYGERQQVEHTGQDGGPVELRVRFLRETRP